MIVREACVGCYEQAVTAVKRGADRIELCQSLLEGGITPSYGNLLLTKATITTPVNVIIRPRGGDYIYTSAEYRIMQEDAALCKKLGFNGIVFGILTPDKEVDLPRCSELINLVRPLSVTFHMAFDDISDKKAAIDNLSTLGFDRVLTKGGNKCALDNIASLRDLVNYAASRIIIMPGGGVTIDNFREVVRQTGAKEVHGTNIV